MRSWHEGMASAYLRGVRDGRMGAPSRPAGEMFRACYEQGYEHGARGCLEKDCPCLEGERR